MASGNIVVVGSCMMDFVSYAPRLPHKGETIHGTKFQINFGGKGANQCVAAAKLGGKSHLVARVGDDIWADKYLENLKTQNVGTEFVKKTAKSASGIAQITVSDSGDNQIVIVAGANKQLANDDVELAKKLIQTASVVVLQLETSVETALKTLQLCQGSNIISILNGAPALSKFEPLLLQLPTIFCVNETEAEIFTGLPVKTKSEAEKAARWLITHGCHSVVLTLGAQGALYLSKTNNELISVDCPQVECVDSTGAGDAFIGALAFLLCEHNNLPMKKILEIACFIASDSCTKLGTQPSFPGASILEELAL